MSDTAALRVRERFWVKAVRDPETECWEWIASRNENGYGWFYDGADVRLVHRWVHEAFIGPIPEGLTIDHLCRNRGCVNPGHLEAVTIGENTLRSPIGLLARNLLKTECSRGHPYDEANTRIDRNGWRHCRACNRLRMHARASA